MRFISAIVLLASMASNSSLAAGAFGRVTELSAEAKARMVGVAWVPGCPVPLSELRQVSVSYFGFDGETHQGIIVVHQKIADDVAVLFDDLLRSRVALERVDVWENYGPNVYAKKNVTVGFYCEKADDAPTEWSSHAYGMAVDINPKLNPFHGLDKVWWPVPDPTLVARDGAPGKVSTDSAAFAIFTRHGWTWGGFDAAATDYMHFVKATAGDGERTRRPYIVKELLYVPQDATEHSPRTLP